MKKQILNNNIVLVIKEFEESLKDGWRFVPNKSDLFSSMMGLKELSLYKEEVEINLYSVEDVLDVAYVESYDKVNFFISLQKLILSGWEVDLESIIWCDIGTKRVKVKHPDHPASKIYSKEELQEMDFESLKQIAKIRGCFNRQRSVCVQNILKFQDNKEE